MRWTIDPGQFKVVNAKPSQASGEKTTI